MVPLPTIVGCWVWGGVGSILAKGQTERVVSCCARNSAPFHLRLAGSSTRSPDFSVPPLSLSHRPPKPFTIPAPQCRRVLVHPRAQHRVSAQCLQQGLH